MTISTYTGLNTALSGLEAMQAGIDTTGENIANASTPGYSEQVVDLGESESLTIPTGSESTGGYQMGTGVSVDDITRQRDAFLDVQYRAQNTQASANSTLASQLGDVQAAIGTSATSGIGAALTSFYSAWSSLSTDPTSSAAQQAVVSAGQTLAQTFNAASGQMATIQSQASQQYAALTGSSGEVEQYANQIASLNTQIAASQAEGISANTLEDQRDNAIDSLSSLAQVSVTTGTDGQDTISFGDAATPLVSGSTVTWPQTLTAAAGGQLGTLQSLSSATGPIGTLSSSLDSVASSVISQVNSLQSASSPFFSGTSASTIAVTATASTVQASSNTANGSSGDLASEIAAGADSATGGYATFVGQVGDAVQSANNANTTSQSLLTAVSNQRQSVSGVSLDQEMTNLITYQQGYQASARMMSTMQSVLQTLIDSVGSAGV